MRGPIKNNILAFFALLWMTPTTSHAAASESNGTFIGYVERSACEGKAKAEGYKSFRIGSDRKVIGGTELYDCYGTDKLPDSSYLSTFIGYQEPSKCEEKARAEGYDHWKIGTDRKVIGGTELFDCYGLKLPTADSL